MIRIKLKQLLSDKEFREGRAIKLADVAAATGIHRNTLAKIANERGYNTGTDNLNRLCGYLGCRVEELLEYIPDVPDVGS